MIQEIYVIDEQNDLTEQLSNIFRNEYNYRFKRLGLENLEIALKNIPSLIIINEDFIQGDIMDVCKTIRENDSWICIRFIVINSGF